MTSEQLIERLRLEFDKQLGSTGQYNKAGMQLAFEKAVTATLVHFWTQELTK